MIGGKTLESYRGYDSGWQLTAMTIPRTEG